MLTSAAIVAVAAVVAVFTVCVRAFASVWGWPCSIDESDSHFCIIMEYAPGGKPAALPPLASPPLAFPFSSSASALASSSFGASNGSARALAQQLTGNAAASSFLSSSSRGLVSIHHQEDQAREQVPGEMENERIGFVAADATHTPRPGLSSELPNTLPPRCSSPRRHQQKATKKPKKGRKERPVF